MQIEKTSIEGLYVITPTVFEDARGYFYESFSQRALKEAGIAREFVQDNQSKSSYGVIRGLHFQNPPHAQTKLIRALQGAILDVAVDIRKGSPTYGKVFSILLSEDNKQQLLVPRGMAHGFSVLSEKTVIHYKCDDFYAPETEGGIRFDDPTLQINWQIPADKVLLSEKDKLHPFLNELDSAFTYKQ